MSETREPQTTTSAKTGIEGWKVFLETTPPNTPLKIPGVFSFNPNITEFDFETPHIQLHCEHDDGPRRFDPTQKNVDVTFQEIQGNYNFITYRCRDCQTASKTFASLGHSDRHQ